jgi:hypothetical protein
MEKTDVRIRTATPRKNVMKGMNHLGPRIYPTERRAVMTDKAATTTGKNRWNPVNELPGRSIPEYPMAHGTIKEQIPKTAPIRGTTAINPRWFI